MFIIVDNKPNDSNLQPLAINLNVADIISVVDTGENFRLIIEKGLDVVSNETVTTIAIFKTKQEAFDYFNQMMSAFQEGVLVWVSPQISS